MTGAQLGILTTLPSGAYVSPATTAHYYPPCLIRVPDGAGRCYRPQGHRGRHVFVGPSGRVWNVWGTDEHKAKRELAKSGGAA